MSARTASWSGDEGGGEAFGLANYSTILDAMIQSDTLVGQKQGEHTWPWDIAMHRREYSNGQHALARLRQAACCLLRHMKAKQ